MKSNWFLCHRTWTLYAQMAVELPGAWKNFLFTKRTTKEPWTQCFWPSHYIKNSGMTVHTSWNNYLGLEWWLQRYPTSLYVRELNLLFISLGHSKIDLLQLFFLQALHSMGVKSFGTLAEADPRRIEIVTGRKYPFGNHLKDSLHSLPPKVEMKVEETECQRQGKLKLVVTLTRLSQTFQPTKRHYADMVYSSRALHNFVKRLMQYYF